MRSMGSCGSREGSCRGSRGARAGAVAPGGEILFGVLILMLYEGGTR